MKENNCTKAFSIGDSIEKDLTPAKEAGLKTILFTQKEMEKPKNVDYMIKELIQLLEIIK